MRLSQLLAPTVTVAVLAITPAAAQAAFSVSSVAATPSSTQAGAHADFAINIGFGADDNVRNLVLHLPRGFVGNPQAAGLCTQAQFATDACPAASQVGTTTVTATVVVNSLLSAVPQTQDVSGQVFNLQPPTGEPARLGVLLPATAAAGGVIVTRPVRMQSVVSVRSNSDYGLDSTLKDLPRTIDTNVGTLNSHIDRIQLNLRGRVPGAPGPFLTNPTTCVPATTTVDATAYNGAASSKASSYTPTACDALTYDPKITAALDGAGTNQHPQLTTVVSQTAEEATSKKVVVTLPLGVGPDLAALNVSCPSPDFDAGGCADNTKVGSAIVETPLLADPLAGTVYLVNPPGGGLPQLGIDLRGLLPVKLRGTVTIGAGARLVSTLDGLPDVPLSRFTLTLNGGAGGLLISSTDLCAKPPTIDAAFTAQAGIERTASATVTTTNCVNPTTPSAPSASPAKARKPSVKAKLSKAGSLSVKATVPAKASKLRGIRVSLPKGVTGYAGKRLTATKRSGARSITVRVPARLLKVQRAKLSGKTRVTVVATTAAGRTYRVKVKLRR